MLFNDFIHQYNLKNKETSNIKIYQILSSIGLDIVGIYLGDGQFSSDIGTVNLHPTKRSHCVVYINEIYIDSYGFLFGYLT